MLTDEQWREIERRRKQGGYGYHSRQAAQLIAAGKLLPATAPTAAWRAYREMVREVVGLPNDE